MMVVSILSLITLYKLVFIILGKTSKNIIANV